MISLSPQGNLTSPVFEYLAKIDISKNKRLVASLCSVNAETYASSSVPCTLTRARRGLWSAQI